MRARCRCRWRLVAAASTRRVHHQPHPHWAARSHPMPRQPHNRRRADRHETTTITTLTTKQRSQQIRWRERERRERESHNIERGMFAVMVEHSQFLNSPALFFFLFFSQIGPDGTVSFGPNLSLLMSSLAVRFGDVDHDDGDTPPAGRSHRARAHSGGGSMHADSLHSPLSSLTSRKRTDAKKREWAAMNALFSKAMEDKQTSKEQQQWFMARFNYPLIHQPSTAPNMPHHPPNSHPNHPHPPTGDLNTHAPTNEHVHLLHSSHIAYEKGAYLEEAKQEYERR